MLSKHMNVWFYSQPCEKAKIWILILLSLFLLGLYIVLYSLYTVHCIICWISITDSYESLNYHREKMNIIYMNSTKCYQFEKLPGVSSINLRDNFTFFNACVSFELWNLKYRPASLTSLQNFDTYSSSYIRILI